MTNNTITSRSDPIPAAISQRIGGPASRSARIDGDRRRELKRRTAST
jgi:hypothetical protein